MHMDGIHQEETPIQKNVVIFLKTDDFVTFWWYSFESEWYKNKGEI